MASDPSPSSPPDPAAPASSPAAPPARDPVGRFLVGLVLVVCGLAGLGMSLCGGVFTLTALFQHEMVGALVLALPSLAIGVGLIWLALKLLRRLRG